MTNFDLMSKEALTDLIDAARVALAKKRFVPGMKVYHIGKGGMVLQGKVTGLNPTGSVSVIHKGEYMPSSAVPAEKLYESYEVACNEAKRRLA